MKEKSQSVEIWGNGTARREFLYVDDFADFVAFATNNFEKVPSVMNVGLGTDYSINEYYEAAAQVMDYRGSFTHNRAMPVGMNRKLVNVSEQEKLGWKPTTSLQTGIRETYKYFLSIDCNNHE
jgi:GDP-L-fucose synthase